MQSIVYYRQNKNWAKWFGKTGKVLFASLVQVAGESTSAFAPYSLVMVSFGKQKKFFCGLPGEEYQPGDKVNCVLRRVEQPDKQGVVAYGIKVKKFA